MEKAKERAVLVCTEYRGVFFGYASQTAGNTIRLKRARNVLYWPAINQGVFGLASIGPVEGAKVGPAVDIELRKVICVVEVSPKAIKRWNNTKWKY